MPELDHYPENESHYSCDDCNDSGIHNETREYCECRKGLERCNSDKFADMLQGAPYKEAMFTMNQATMKSEHAIAAAEMAVLKSKLLQAERSAAQPVVLTDERIDEIMANAAAEANVKAGNLCAARQFDRLYVRAILAAIGVPA